MKCINCNHELPDDSIFCSYCGTKSEQKKLCRNCGAETLSDAMFCHKCGARIESLQTENNPDKESEADVENFDKDSSNDFYLRTNLISECREDFNKWLHGNLRSCKGYFYYYNVEKRMVYKANRTRYSSFSNDNLIICINDIIGFCEYFNVTAKGVFLVYHNYEEHKLIFFRFDHDGNLINTFEKYIETDLKAIPRDYEIYIHNMYDTKLYFSIADCSEDFRYRINFQIDIETGELRKLYKWTQDSTNKCLQVRYGFNDYLIAEDCIVDVKQKKIKHYKGSLLSLDVTKNVLYLIEKGVLTARDISLELSLRNDIDLTNWNDITPKGNISYFDGRRAVFLDTHTSSVVNLEKNSVSTMSDMKGVIVPTDSIVDRYFIYDTFKKIELISLDDFICEEYDGRELDYFAEHNGYIIDKTF